jgi:prepilin signal peptidase PulO-like enzyme (type II secretory pathway)
MDPVTIIILFVFGIIFGSFLNVVILRYDGEHFLLDTKMLGGRSHCMHCKATLRWFELVPLFSFLIQGGRCRRCKAPLSFQYPIVELLSGLLFVFVPLAMGVFGAAAVVSMFAAILWVSIFEALLVMAVIDIRLGIIPDEINLFLTVAGIALAIIATASLGGQESVIWAKLIGAVVAGAFFGALIAITRGKGMGMGDLKLVIPLGLIFGWPEIILVMMLSFVIGAAVGIFAIIRGKKSMKGTLPFGPFLALAAAAVFFWGTPIINWYFSLLGIR